MKLIIDNKQITSNLNKKQLTSLAEMINDGTLSNFKEIKIKSVRKQSK